MNKYMEKVLDAVNNAHSICWDGCHKIYIMDDVVGTQTMMKYEYPFIFTKDEMSPKEMAGQIRKWYKNSCSLRFISLVSGTGEDNYDYTDVVSQMETWK